jgi:hypothetical protein
VEFLPNLLMMKCCSIVYEQHSIVKLSIVAKSVYVESPVEGANTIRSCDSGQPESRFGQIIGNRVCVRTTGMTCIPAAASR